MAHLTNSERGDIVILIIVLSLIGAMTATGAVMWITWLIRVLSG
jgi:hypothetical protein